MEKIVKSPVEWQHQLTAEQYAVTREGKTELPFSGRYYHCDRDGIYRCVCCANALFSSRTKFESGSGWPSFWAPVDADHVILRDDHTLGMTREEVLCAACEAHLGHVFSDGPPPTHLRYCINSTALELDETPDPDTVG